MRTAVALALLVLALCAHGQSVLTYSAHEKARLLAHGPWPPAPRHDPTNRVSGRAEAIALGERLFFDPRLSGTGSVLCASCHIPFRHFQDAKARAFGLALAERNTPSLINAGLYRWYGWDGANDSLWSQSLRPLLDPREMRSSPAQIAALMRSRHAKDYEAAFGRALPADDEAVFVDAGKALAAFQETLVSGRTPFDEFRDALERGDLDAAARFPVGAQRGALLFVGKAGCSACHAGGAFTNGDFAQMGTQEPARALAIRRLKASPYNLLGRYNDDPTGPGAGMTRALEPRDDARGVFRVPGLRNVALTAPYMHDGRLATLREVLRSHGPVALSAHEQDDLLVFLRSLTETRSFDEAPLVRQD
jgi:cytochrome c peroxidase